MLAYKIALKKKLKKKKRVHMYVLTMQFPHLGQCVYRESF